MNVASLLNASRPGGSTPGALKLLRIETGLLAQALLGSVRESARESVLAFRFMRSLLLDGSAAIPLK